MDEKTSTILPGTVEKIINPPFPSMPEKAQITVEGGDHLYREIRIDNTLTNDKGEEVSAQTRCVGTTRSRVSFFMNRFRKMGFVDYNGGGFQVHSSLLNVVLHD